ncbi:phosphotransferase [Roseomonas sp. USHLN139]|uniref:phosphotransferase n=1 Tax=Roseomonas sp. USHLN139 TaxID=3081298 RepID=UPI003B02AFA8
MTEQLGAVLDNPVPAITLAEAEALARDAFGLAGTVRPLTAERDRNFLLTTGDGRDYAMRVINAAEDPAVSDFQSRALMHAAAADPALPVPRLHPPLAGSSPEAVWQPADGGAPCRVRVLDYLPGRPLYQTAPDRAQRTAIGQCLARLDAALAGFRHPAESHVLLWDIQRALQLRGAAAQLPDPEDRGLALGVLDRFERHALPGLGDLRPQVIHNDFNPHNILADAVDDRRITGIIDFGDMVRAPLVQDLATAAAYSLAPEGHPLEGPAQLIAAFDAACPLWEEELEVLADLIATRCAVSVVISGWRALRQPENADYILRNYPRSLSGLRRMGALPRQDAQTYLREALGR